MLVARRLLFLILVSAVLAGSSPAAHPESPARQTPAQGQGQGQAAGAADVSALVERVRAFRAAREPRIVEELRDLVALPNVASDADGIARNAAWLQARLRARGFSTALLTPPDTPSSPPAVFGELTAPGATRTVVFYAHYDGQPVSPAEWATPPWEVTLRTGRLEEGGVIVPWSALPASIPGEHRLYGRSASDDKGPIVALLTALDALAAVGQRPSVNVKVFLEGEEEAGSPHLASLLRAHAERLHADAWIFGDGPVHQSRRPLVSFGVRGTVGLELTTYGPNRALHSGHYGNWAPNPAADLAHLLAGLRDREGRILIEGLDRVVRPLSPTERDAIANEPPVDDALAESLALGRREQVRERLLEAVTVPALNVRGLRAGEVGARAANAVPTQAQVSIDFRLVPDVTPSVIRTLVEAHLRTAGYHVVTDAPDEATRRAHPRVVRVQWGPGYPAHRTSMDLPISRALIEVVRQATGVAPVLMPTMGGSLPLYLFDEILRTPLVTVPVVNHDNNQHAANENLRVQNLWDAIEVYAAMLVGLDGAWTAASPGPAAP